MMCPDGAFKPKAKIDAPVGSNFNYVFLVFMTELYEVLTGVGNNPEEHYLLAVHPKQSDRVFTGSFFNRREGLPRSIPQLVVIESKLLRGWGLELATAGHHKTIYYFHEKLSSIYGINAFTECLADIYVEDGDTISKPYITDILNSVFDVVSYANPLENLYAAITKIEMITGLMLNNNYTSSYQLYLDYKSIA